MTFRHLINGNTSLRECFTKLDLSQFVIETFFYKERHAENFNSKFRVYHNFSGLIPEASHALTCLMKRNTGELATQLLDANIISFLLDVLAGKVEGW